MQEGIFLEELTENEKFVKFEKGKSYSVPANIRHQIVHDADMNDIGIAFSRNGRIDFRQYNKGIIYWYTQPYAWVVSRPMGEEVDLTELV